MTNAIPIDISKFPDLLRIAEEVQTTKTARLLKRDRESIAMLMPVVTAGKSKKWEKTKADYEAFRAAGSWKDMDIEKFKADISASRKIATRPRIEL